MAAIFFANQGNTFEIVKNHGYMFTAEFNPDGKRNRNFKPLGDMREGDVVIINNGGLVATAMVLGSGCEEAMTAEFAKLANDAEDTNFWREGMLGLKVNVALDLLPEKIRYQDYREVILEVQRRSSRPKDSPFLDSGHAKTSTFWWLEPELGALLMEICGRPLPGALSRLPKPPYVPLFAQREVRQEQSDFRRLMLELWDGQCPVSGTKHERLLEAAHFLNWRHHNDAEAGMLLDCRVHAALDAGLLKISLNEATNLWTVTVEPEGFEDLGNLDGKVFRNVIARGAPRLKT